MKSIDKTQPYLITGGKHIDERGCIKFINDFDMSAVKRLYFTEHFTTDVIRAWQAHIVEKRWFLCVEGEFLIKLVKIDDFENPSENLRVFKYYLESKTPQILYIPEGYANGFQAKKENSKLMIFADYALGVNPDDQIRYDKNKWSSWK